MGQRAHNLSKLRYAGVRKKRRKRMRPGDLFFHTSFPPDLPYSFTAGSMWQLWEKVAAKIGD